MICLQVGSVFRTHVVLTVIRCHIFSSVNKTGRSAGSTACLSWNLWGRFSLVSVSLFAIFLHCLTMIRNLLFTSIRTKTIRCSSGCLCGWQGGRWSRCSYQNTATAHASLILLMSLVILVSCWARWALVGNSVLARHISPWTLVWWLGVTNRFAALALSPTCSFLVTVSVDLMAHTLLNLTRRTSCSWLCSCCYKCAVATTILSIYLWVWFTTILITRWAFTWTIEWDVHSYGVFIYIFLVQTIRILGSGRWVGRWVGRWLCCGGRRCLWRCSWCFGWRG